MGVLGFAFSIELNRFLHNINSLNPTYEGDRPRLRLIKTFVTKHYGEKLGIARDISASRQKRKERNLWQLRFWEHLIRDERDFAQHCDYIHYNPVRHGLCETPQDWQFSSIHRFIAQGIYPPNWGVNEVPEIPKEIGNE